MRSLGLEDFDSHKNDAIKTRSDFFIPTFVYASSDYPGTGVDSGVNETLAELLFQLLVQGEVIVPPDDTDEYVGFTGPPAVGEQLVQFATVRELAHTNELNTAGEI